MRWFIFSFGWVCVGLGAIGVVLPVLPTTPFMLLAAACFAKTSPKFHHWLLNSKVFGQLIRNWNEERFIEPSAKMRSLLVIALTYGVSIYLVDKTALRVMLIVLWLICTVCVSRLPTVPKSIRGLKNAAK